MPIAKLKDVLLGDYETIGLNGDPIKYAMRLLTPRIGLEGRGLLTRQLTRTLVPPGEVTDGQLPLSTGWDLTPGDRSQLFGLLSED